MRSPVTSGRRGSRSSAATAERAPGGYARRQLRAGANPAIVLGMSCLRDRVFPLLLLAPAGLGELLLRPARRYSTPPLGSAHPPSKVRRRGGRLKRSSLAGAH